jgi:hypothetical protein
MITRRLALASFAAAAVARPAKAHDTNVYAIAGSYTAYGMNADGSTYSGQVQIIQNGNAVQVYWNVGGQNYSGQGLVQGQVVTVDWGASTPVIYVLVGNELHGTWDNGRALERLVP